MRTRTHDQRAARQKARVRAREDDRRGQPERAWARRYQNGHRDPGIAPVHGGRNGDEQDDQREMAADSIRRLHDPRSIDSGALREARDRCRPGIGAGARHPHGERLLEIHRARD
jgi:hypothetical protein